MKVDVARKVVLESWEDDDGCLASEPTFIPSPHNNNSTTAEEDSGVLIFVCHSTTARKTSLVVLRSKDLKELGRFTAPVATTFGIHGIWIPN